MGACYPSHKIAAQSADFGPNLTEFAKQRTPKKKIEAISKPFATISHEHEGSNGVTKDSTSIIRILQATKEPVIVKNMGKLTLPTPREKVKSTEKLNRSLMYDPEQMGLSGQSIADIVAYHKSL